METIRIAVFDFNSEECSATANAVDEHFEMVCESVVISQFTDMQKFAYTFRDGRLTDDPFSMVFVGVDNMLGVETARNIRSLDKHCPMFLVSKVGDYGIEGFRLNALDYLVKPVTAERVKEAVTRIGMACLMGMQ